MAQVAANFAVCWHAGIFSSGALEELLRRIGEKAVPFSTGKRSCRAKKNISILHVATELSEIGGHTRMITRWVDHDTKNTHSLALTRQHGEIPRRLGEALSKSGGSVNQINMSPGGVLHWAKQLQHRIAKADAVILHIHNMDIIPLLALSGMKFRPPVALLNHSDHLFWLGAGMVDRVVSTRRSGQKLCVDRRGIEDSRNILIPLCLEPALRVRSRVEAKKALNLPPDSVVLLTIARSVKFRPMGEERFPDPLISVVNSDPNVHFIIVGPGETDDWSYAREQTSGRIIVLPETRETGVYLEAADIYIDSFPFVSITSMFEAGLYGLPLVTRNAFGPGCEVMAADLPGLDDVVIRAESGEELREAVQSLVDNPRRRDEIGARTKTEIESINMGDNWRAELASMYEHLMSNIVDMLK